MVHAHAGVSHTRSRQTGASFILVIPKKLRNLPQHAGITSAGLAISFFSGAFTSFVKRALKTIPRLFGEVCHIRLAMALSNATVWERASSTASATYFKGLRRYVAWPRR